MSESRATMGILNEASVVRPRFYSNVDASTLNYFEHVEKMMDEDLVQSTAEMKATDEKEDEDDAISSMCLFLNNVYKEIEGKEVLLACDHETSRVLEKILMKSNDFQLRVFLDRLSGQYVSLSKDRFASHVLQTLLSLGTQVIDREVSSKIDKDSSEPNSEQTGTGVLLLMHQLVAILMEQFFVYDEETNGSGLKDLMFDPYASHVIRGLIASLSGVKQNSSLKSKSSIQFHKEHHSATQDHFNEDGFEMKRIPASFLKIKAKLLHLLVRDLDNMSLRKMIFHTSVNPVLQMLLIHGTIGKDTSVPKRLIELLMNTGDDHQNLSKSHMESMMRHQVASHFIERMIKVADKEAFHDMYTNYFRGNLKVLASDPVATYVVKTLISSAKSEPQALMIIEELTEVLEEILAIGKNGHGIVEKMAQTCVLFNIYQKEFLKAIFKAFHLDKVEDRLHLVNLLIHLETLEHFRDGSIAHIPNTQGALILKPLFLFDKDVVVPLVESFVFCVKEKHYDWCTEAIRSRVVESFLASNAELKSKQRFINRLRGQFYRLAMDKYGSHIVDRCWTLVDIKTKETIADELLAKEDDLKANHYGRFVVRNCSLDHYKKTKPVWIERERALEKKKKMFDDLLETTRHEEPSGPVSSLPTGMNQIEARLRARDADLMDPMMLSLGYTKEIMNSSLVPKQKNETSKSKKRHSNERSHDNDDSNPLESDGSMLLEPHETMNSDDLNEIDHVFKKGKHKSNESIQPKSSTPETKIQSNRKDSRKSAAATKGLGAILKAVDLSTGRKSGRKSKANSKI